MQQMPHMRICRRNLFFCLGLTIGLALVVPALAQDSALSLDANRQFLANHARQSGVVTTASGLQYHILSRGFGRHPGAGDNVQIVYSARLINGTVVDRASTDLPATLSIGNALRGLSEALQLMQAGDRWELVIPADLALGSKQTSTIPANQTLIFDLTLVAIAPPSSASGAQDESPFSLFSRERGKDAEAGAMIRIPQ